MPNYFGWTAEPVTYESPPSASWSRNKNIVFTCPGTGQQQVKEISAYVRATTGTVRLRLAIYDQAHNLVCQGNVYVTVNTTLQWWGHLVVTDITPNPCYLTGGVTYDIAVTSNGANIRYYYQAGSTGDVVYAYTDYTGGFPSSLADGTDWESRYSMRIGVDPAILYGGYLGDMKLGHNGLGIRGLS